MMAVQELVERYRAKQQKKNNQYLVEKRWRNGWRNGWAKVPTPRNIWRRHWDGETPGETVGKIEWRHGGSQRKNCFFGSRFGPGSHCSSTVEFCWRNGGRNGLKSKVLFLRKCGEKVGGETSLFFAEWE